MPSTCKFELNNPNGVYFSGDTIIGTVILTTTSPKEVRDVRLLFEGAAKVHWTETERKKNSDGSYTNHIVHFRAKTLYVQENIKLAGEGTLPPGTYRYDIRIYLPVECPTSCEGRYGHVRYELTVKLDRPFRFDNVFTKPLTIIRTLDLNLNPSLSLPIEEEDVFSPCCWSCTGDNIEATVKLPHGGYANGQRVRYTVHVANRSMNDIGGYKVKFNQTMTFTAHTPQHKTRSVKKELYRNVVHTQCLRLSSQVYTGNFVIDATAPSTEENSIINIYYTLKVTLQLKGCATDKDLRIRVVIGTIPLRESLLPTPTAPANETNPLIAITPTAPQLMEGNTDLPPSYKDVGPPSFEEATRSHSPFIDMDKDEHNRHIGFRPLYPTYSQSDE
ncbi:hypothetical protein DOY81_007935 [Sarcophaga bullata]|nr:hypothetical protein DOY81_007935 [Sarcophaga bullata]